MAEIDRRAVLAGLALLGAARPTTAAPPSVAWPQSTVLDLWPDAPPGHATYRPDPVPESWPAHFLRAIETPRLHVFRLPRPDGRAILVCPGGAYLFVSVENEGIDVARTFTAAGITVAVLSYRLPGEGWTPRGDAPLQDAQRALRLLRANAGTLGIDPDGIGVMGFSAGGHLAASLATAWDEPVYAPVDDIDHSSARPAHVALLYPVITLDGPFAHTDTRHYLLGATPDPHALQRRLPQHHVDGRTPRMFIAHATDDASVAVDNALLMHAACRVAGVAVELHLFERGGHAFGTGIAGTPCALWPALYTAWLTAT